MQIFQLCHLSCKSIPEEMYGKKLPFSHGTRQIGLFLLCFGITPALRNSGRGQESPVVAAAQVGGSLQLKAWNLLDRKSGVDIWRRLQMREKPFLIVCPHCGYPRVATVVHPTSVRDMWTAKNNLWVVQGWVKGEFKSYRIHKSTDLTHCNLKQICTAQLGLTCWRQHWGQRPSSSKILVYRPSILIPYLCFSLL